MKLRLIMALSLGLFSPFWGQGQQGTLKWKFQTGAQIRWSSPAIGPNGVIYIGSMGFFGPPASAVNDHRKLIFFKHSPV